MKANNRVFFTALSLAALTAGLWAQTQVAANAGPGEGNPAAKAAAATSPAAVPAAPITAADIQSLRDAIAAQQAEIQALQQQLAQKAASIQATTITATPAQPAIQAAAITATPVQPAIQPVVASAAPQQGAATSAGLNLQDADQKPANPMEGPLSIHFKGITLTPGGYVEAAFIRRSRALGADITTPFNSVTMPGASQSQMSEFFGSARQSKITTFAEGRLANVDLSSYVSADFLSSGITSTSTQTNSYTLRLRQFWGQAKFDNGFSFLGGQEWSLMTEDAVGISPDDDLGRTNDVRPKVIDPGYNVGFTFARQYGLRVTQKFNNVVSAAVAMENSEGTLSTHGNGDNFLLGSAGSGSGAYNSGITNCTTSLENNGTTPLTVCTPAGTYTFNPSPDVIAKLAFDPGFGHYEVFAMYDRFRDRVFPCGEVALPALSNTGPCPNGIAGNGPTALGAYNVSKNGGGFGANARWNFFDKHITFGLHGFGGSGTGRYGAATLPDLAIRANGSPYLIKNLQGLATLEWKGKKLDVDLYTGTEYAGRATTFDPISGAYVGYGSPFANNSGCSTEQPPTSSNGFIPASLSKCTADTRAIIEGTAAIWYRFYNGPHGRFQYGMQYSYVSRNTWSGANGIAPHGIDGMVFTSFRYYLP